MFGVTPTNLGAALLGGLVAIYLLSLLFRYALLGRNGTKLRQLWVVMLTGIVAIGFSGFGDGTGGFENRITNPPDMVKAIAYALSAIVVAFFVWLRADEAPQPAEMQPKTRSIIGRAVALVFVIPIILIGFGNLAGSAYSIALYGPPPGPGLGVSRAELRQIMLNGAMAPFWAMVDEKAPVDLDFIIERMFAAEDNYRSPDDVLAQLNIEVVNYRIRLAVYGPALTDEQRQTVIRSQVEFLREFQDDPETCIIVFLQGGAGLSQAQLSEVSATSNRTVTAMMGVLIDARLAASEGATIPAAPTEEDYTLLVSRIYEEGFTEDQVMAYLNDDFRHPGYCDIAIGYSDAIAGFEGPAGERIRYETVQLLLTSPPQ